METAVAERTEVRPEWTVKKGAFFPCDASFRVNDIQRESCGMRSYYFALVNNIQLSFCGHHATKYEVGLLEASKGRVIDLRHTIAD